MILTVYSNLATYVTICFALALLTGCNSSQPTPPPDAQPVAENEEETTEELEPAEPTAADLAKFVSSFGQNLATRNYEASYGQTSKSLQERTTGDEFTEAAMEHLDEDVVGSARMGSVTTGLTEARGEKPWLLRDHPEWSDDVPEEKRVGRGLILIPREKLGYLNVAVTVIQEEGELRIEQYKFGGDELSKRK